MSRSTQELEYDFKKHMGEPVKIRLVHDFQDEYAMEFCLLNERPCWNQVQQYFRTIDHTYEPGSGWGSSGVWSTRWFKVNDLDHAKKILEYYRGKINTVADIYSLFIEKGVRERERDMEAYKKYKEHLNSIPDTIE
ncbi:MAG: hypothetical protein IKN15_04965 [Bacteroidaceae bacterium]|nr:hypothetical protein [Bacteroidaceae bacterium]